MNKTKIVATVGPASRSYENLLKVTILFSKIDKVLTSKSYNYRINFFIIFTI